MPEAQPVAGLPAKATTIRLWSCPLSLSRAGCAGVAP